MSEPMRDERGSAALRTLLNDYERYMDESKQLYDKRSGFADLGKLVMGGSDKFSESPIHEAFRERLAADVGALAAELSCGDAQPADAETALRRILRLDDEGARFGDNTTLAMTLVCCEHVGLPLADFLDLESAERLCADYEDYLDGVPLPNQRRADDALRDRIKRLGGRPPKRLGPIARMFTKKKTADGRREEL